jgi:quercetin dioxygenase-like cupin family protein
MAKVGITSTSIPRGTSRTVRTDERAAEPGDAICSELRVLTAAVAGCILSDMAEVIVSRATDVLPGPAGMMRAGGDQTAGRYDFMVSTIPYLAGPPLHVHDEQDDAFLVLDGVLTIQVGDDLVDLHPGDFASVPPGVAHTFSNIRADQAPVRAVNLMTPGGFDAYFRDMMSLAGQPDQETMNEIGRRHGITWVGPTIAAKLGLQPPA